VSVPCGTSVQEVTLEQVSPPKTQGFSLSAITPPSSIFIRVTTEMIGPLQDPVLRDSSFTSSKTHTQQVSR
jgi:hypothetical protein